MEIFRVQDKDGRGPYRPGITIKWMDKYRCEEERPPFQQEFGTNFLKKKLCGTHYGCGFETIDQLNYWFSRTELKKLKKLGYSIVKISVDRIIEKSDKQLIFSTYDPIKDRIIEIY